MESKADLNLLIEHVLHTAREHDLWKTHDAIVVAVSGGPDSVALLHILHQISIRHVPLKLICAHVHHGLRAESDSEEELVRGLARELAIPFEVARVDVPSYMKESGKGFEEAARDKRYAFLHEMAQRHGAASIALAHHADDQAETVLLHLLRGSGLGGLKGMRMKRSEKNVELIRPFLRMYKTDLLNICEQNGYAYAVDNSNFSNKYRRNAIRLDVLPLLGQYNGQIKQSLVQLAEIAGVEDDYMEQAANHAYHEMVQYKDGRLYFRAPSFLALHVALQRRLIKLILNYLSAGCEIADFNKIELIRQGIIQNKSTTWSLDIGGGLACIREYDMILFMHKPPEQSKSYTYELQTAVPELCIPEIGMKLKMKLQSPHDSYFSTMAGSCAEAVFDAGQLQFPLTLRSRLPGDTMKVMGLNGSKKVKDIFIDAKIPPSVRSRIPVLVDGLGHIIWIPGVRRSAHAAVGTQTVSVLHMRLEDAKAVEQL
ncbi:tRNA lysidine(34) synthetase TilS [Paenibacillus sp.]|jgi:tRNA(Ile)-lysidine synthase|uniref:tRNA lysidine(34) synthetase TilS n=1 Tax=Paenibacillus sp. TaxID=58172 RepID=UPI00281D00C4|nr:tRNA lysidine(34) synthetase TilS [Paenibacillus sp.]MDR0270151.1 tRNA lysidine(34) synthetase TilS [Paenibacillus sp.]